MHLFRALYEQNSCFWGCLSENWAKITRQKFPKNFQNLEKNHIFFFKIEKYFFLKSIQNCLKRVLNRKSWNRFCTGVPGDRSIFSSIRPTKGPFGAFCRPYFGYCRPHEMGHIPKSYYFHIHYNHGWFWWHCCRFQRIFVIFWRIVCRFSLILRWILAEKFLKIITP